jgi:hypothetical protein
MERIIRVGAPAPRFTPVYRWDYTVAELRELAREHGITGTSRMTHEDLVKALRDADVELPAKSLTRMPPYHRRQR